MKTLLLCLFLLPSIAFGEEFRYSKVHTQSAGKDNFSVNVNKVEDADGTIRIENGQLSVNGKTFTLEPTGDPQVFKTGNGYIKLVYQEDLLVAVRVYRYATVRSYILEQNTIASAHR